MSVNPEDFGAVSATVKIDPAQFGAIANIDEERGAPGGVRTAVGASKTPQDKLSTLQQYYPDATPWGADNFVYTDNETGNRTLYNPKGLDMGDVSESARMLFEFLGGSIGAAGAVIGGQLGPQVFAPEELLTVPIATGVGAAAGGQAYDAIASIFYPHADTRKFLERSAGIGTDVLANAIGVRAGELVEKAAKTTMAKGASLARKSSDEIYKAFQRMGVKPTAGAVTGSPTIQGIEQALSKLPASADIIGKEYGTLIDDMGKYAEKVAKGVSPIEGRELVGTEIKKGVDVFVNQFKGKAKTLYDKVDSFIAPGKKVQLTNLGTQLNKFLGEGVDPEVEKLLGTSLINQMKVIHKASTAQVTDMTTMVPKMKGVPYASLKALRTKVGGMLSDGKLIGDTTQGELKQIYAALSDDMSLAAHNVSPEAFKAANRASAFWSAGRSRIDDILNPVVNKKRNQDIFQAAMSGTKSGSETLRAIKKSIPTEEWGAVVAQQIKEMGRATPGAQDVTGELFSPASFLTNYSKLSKEAQKTLFSGPQFKGLDTAINDLVTVSAALKDTAKMANTSGTAQQMMYMNMLTSGSLGGLYGASGEDQNISGGVAAGLAAGAAPWVVAKLITSPKFVSWLADAGRVAVTQTGIGAHLGRLALIAEKDLGLAPAINEYMRTISVSKPEPTNNEAL